MAYLVSVLNGVAIGFLLFILAIGLSLIFGMMDVLNLGHGALFLTGGGIFALHAHSGVLRYLEEHNLKRTKQREARG